MSKATAPAARSARGLDLGTLQSEAEKAARNLKAADAAFKRAKEARDRADADHSVAQKALAAGFEQLIAATKVA